MSRGPITDAISFRDGTTTLIVFGVIFALIGCVMHLIDSSVGTLARDIAIVEWVCGYPLVGYILTRWFPRLQQSSGLGFFWFISWIVGPMVIF